ncbi:MAG: hypothetical protein ACYS26_12950 [Planctomycetota bacterium]|jgi:hypothetical protein
MLRWTLFVFALVGWLLSTGFPWANFHYIACPPPGAQSGPYSWEESVGVGSGPLELWAPGNRFWIEVPVLWVVLAGVTAATLARWGSRTGNPLALGSASLLQLVPSLALTLYLVDELGGGELRLGSGLSAAATACTWSLLGLELKAPDAESEALWDAHLNGPPAQE